MQFVNLFSDEIKFDENGDPAAMYDLVNWQLKPNGGVEFVTVGKFEGMTPITKQKLQLEEENILWTGNQTKVEDSVK